MSDHTNPIDADDVSDDERADMLAEYLDAYENAFGRRPRLMPLDDEGKGPAITARCSLDSPTAEQMLVAADEAVRRIRESGARGFALYAGRDDHGTSDVVFIDDDDPEAFPDDELPATLTVLSGSGRGSHYTYRNAGDVRNARGKEGVDGEVRAENWYVVTPGSVHPTGGVYHVTDSRPIATLDAETVPESLSPRTTPTAADGAGTTTASTGGDAADLDATETPGIDYDPAGTDVDTVRRAETTLTTYLTAGAKAAGYTDGNGEGDRSRADWAAVRTFVEWGVPEADAREALAESPHSKVGERADYWRTTWRNVFSTDDVTPNAKAPSAAPDPDDTTADDGSDDSDEGDDDAPGSILDESPAAVTWEALRAAYTGDEPVANARYATTMKLLADHDYITVGDAGSIYSYHEPDGVFERGGEREIEHELQAGLGPHYSQHEKREILGHIRARTYTDHDELNAGDTDEPLLCVGNGVLNVETRALYDHSPDYAFTRAIPWDYDPDATCPNLDRFMTDITRREADALTMYEMVGHALHPEYVRKKFLILFGPGDNGKTVFYQFVRELLGGPANVSSVQLQQIADNRFASETIVGSYANIAPDMPAKKVSDLGDLKTLTGGEDLFWFEPKGEPGYEAVNTATMLFGCNEPPILPERGEAVKTRLVPVELPYRFTENPDEDDPRQKQARPASDLKDEIVTDDEMSGFLNRALDGLDRLMANNDVSLPESPDGRLTLYEMESDPITKFAVTCLVNEAGENMTKDEMYNTYVEYCRANDVKVTDANVFFRKLRRTTFSYSESRPRDRDRKRLVLDAAFTELGQHYAMKAYDHTGGGPGSEPDGRDRIASGGLGDRERIDNHVRGLSSGDTVTAASVAGALDGIDPETVADRLDSLASTRRILERLGTDDDGRDEYRRL